MHRPPFALAGLHLNMRLSTGPCHLCTCKYAATVLQPTHNLCPRYLDVRDETYREALLSAAAAAQVRPCVPRSLLLCTACSA